MKNDNIIYSIIIPHHNIPHLLQRCLDSIPDRSDVQIIVVDDNSDEDVVDFDKFPIKSRRNVEFVFLKESKGAGCARNVGLSYAKGQWLIFADADDYFNYCINDVLDEYKENDIYDLVFFNANSVDTNTYQNTHRAEHLNGYIGLYEKNKKKGLNKLRYLFGEPWSKMVRRSLVEKNNIKFDETLIHNDTTFSYLVGHYGKNIHVDKRAIYCITVRQGSVSLTLDNNRRLIRLDVFARASRFMQKNNLNIYIKWHCIEIIRAFFVNKKLFSRMCDILFLYGFKKSDILLMFFDFRNRGGYKAIIKK